VVTRRRLILLLISGFPPRFLKMKGKRNLHFTTNSGVELSLFDYKAIIIARSRIIVLIIIR
jgi:hypothetical protein